MGLRGPGAKPVRPGLGPAQPKRKRKPRWQHKNLSRPDRVIAFIEQFKVTSGAHAGKRFRLRDWQREIIHGIYGPCDRKGRRRVRTALITMPRKNGKTGFAAPLALAHLVGPEAEQRGQVYSAAADRDQAAIIFGEMKAMIEQDEDLSNRLIIRDFNKQMEDTETGSIYRALSSDARKAHGLSASMVVYDELAQSLNRDLFDNLMTSTGARAEPLYVVISTQSPNPNHVMSEQIRYGEMVRGGMVDDPTFFPVMYMAPPDADPWDEKTWRACNPALGDFRSLEEMRQFAAQAKRMPAREAAFRALYLNQPVDAVGRFLSSSDWNECADDYDAADLEGRPCFAGLDLASVVDVAALVLLFPPTADDDRWRLLVYFWVPAENIDKRVKRDRVPYDVWTRQEFITATEGNVVDYDVIRSDINALGKRYDIREIAIDRWNSTQLQTQLMGDGFEVVQFGQGYASMSAPTKHLEAVVLSRDLAHPANPVLDWMASNVAVTMDPAGNMKPDKSKSREKIDGMVSLIMALGRAMVVKDEPSPFAVWA